MDADCHGLGHASGALTQETQATIFGPRRQRQRDASKLKEPATENFRAVPDRNRILKQSNHSGCGGLAAFDLASRHFADAFDVVEHRITGLFGRR